MATWHKLILNTQNIEAETERAVLIKMPHSSYYDGFKFWHPKKPLYLRESGGNSHLLILSFTDDFEFKLFKNGNGRYNKSKIIDQRTISASEMIGQFFYFLCGN